MSIPASAREKLRMYHRLLLKWQATINLVSPGTIPDAWDRHFVDSVQLSPLLPSGKRQVLFDLGSGAGFPGMVLAILRPDIAVHLIESDSKKCAFLSAVSRETDTPVTIHVQRIADAARQIEAVPDIITARALAPLTALLAHCAPWMAANPHLTMIFPKGERAEEEVAEAQKNWTFACEKHPSQTDAKASILVIKNASQWTSSLKKEVHLDGPPPLKA